MKFSGLEISTLITAIFFACGCRVNATAAERADSGTVFHVDEGRASYYADSFHGKRTANGETFRLQEYTAAHRSLPFGTTVRVTNLNNGRNVTVRINDRGPHLKNRIIDLSPAAARNIGILGKGTARVRIESLN
ncbi:MAG: septal ring lytic transglycosylase RlpA family protein [Chlorobi bacterium]|nr:septal ring lytic transglycosylase RlpA family protein [Chlorobiota bacterium]